ncbi:WD repeat, SAM and U-box domain-containing protein 1 [Dufourea novaeangliae]|uniref:WD repeat, SAM and U-box domain-containing protein 1 n=1 Tax=Dufourea novaeangliae TaxID=178035 RepID=A0A154P760_DUFNO|nr:WD repeat, SAM and U-box domain-containing protein 1 [Dufourea novaeangliae]
MTGSTIDIGYVQVLQTLKVHTSDVTSVDFASDCVLVTGSGDKRIRVWQWRACSGYVEACFSPLLGHKYGITSVKVSPRSTMLASASIDGTTLLWNLRVGSKIHTMVQTGGEAVRVCRFSPDSTLLVTAGDNGQVCVWDLIRQTMIHTLSTYRCFQQHDGSVQSVCFSPDSSWLITCCTLGVLKLFSTADIIDSCISDKQTVTAFAWIDDAHDLGVVSCDFSISQEVTSNDPFTKLYQFVTCGNDHCVKLWEMTVTETTKCQAELFTAEIKICRIMEKHSSALTCVRFNMNGLYIVSSSLDKTAVIWETRTGKIMATLSGHNRYVACCAFSRDGNLLATGSNDKSVIIWDLTGGLCLDSELARGFLSSTTLLLTDSGETAKHEQDVMKNAETSINDVKLLQRLEDHNGVVNSVAFYGNHLIASGSGDKLVRVWNVETDEDGDSVNVAMKFQEKPYSPMDGHKYSVNHVEFSPCGTMLASCSLDGTAIIWNTENGSQAKSSFVNSGSGIRVCRWSPDGTKIATAGDDEIATTFRGHSDAVNAVAFTHDSRYLVTACNEGSWRLFNTMDNKCNAALMICEEAHDLGVQGCDFSPTANFTLTAGRGLTDDDKQSYLLATSGNDSLVKLWQITVYKKNETIMAGGGSTGSSDCDTRYKQRNVLTGHGGNVTCVRFSPIQGEILGSVATDRTARIWSVYTGDCLYVLEEHESLATTCAFSENTSLFITDRFSVSLTLTIPNEQVVNWRVDDTLKWLKEIGLFALTKRARTIHLTGRLLLNASEDELTRNLQIEQDEHAVEIFKTQLYWLKREDNNVIETPIDDSEIPHEFLCPITHEIMKEPVRCSDGFTYERAAINEWFLCGKYTSPMTNKFLQDTSFITNIELRNMIYTFLHGNRPQS